MRGTVGTFAGPAGAGLRVLVAVHTGRTGAEDFAHVVDGVLVTARRVVLHREGIARPKHDHFRACGQHIDTLRTVELTLVGGVFGHFPRLVFAGEIFGKLLVLRHDGVLKHVFAVVVDAHHLGATLEEGGNDESEDEDCDH